MFNYISLVEMLSWPELVLDFILFTMEIASLDSTVSIYMLLIFGLCRYSLKCLFDFGTPWLVFFPIFAKYELKASAIVLLSDIWTLLTVKLCSRFDLSFSFPMIDFNIFHVFLILNLLFSILSWIFFWVCHTD